MDVVRLWSENARLADGLPFDAQGDVQMAMFDSSWRNLFGSLGVIATRCKAVTEYGVTDKDSAVALQADRLPEICGVLRVLFLCLDWVVPGVTSQGYAWLFRATGILARTERKKNHILDEAIRSARSTSTDGSGEVKMPRINAIKSVLEKNARKEGTKSVTHEALRDEALELLLTGGQSTTSALLLWALKYLKDHTDVQEKLRNQLKFVFDDYCNVSLESSADELVSRSAPFLDAVIAETLRLSATGPVYFPQTVVPCSILGHRIPAGTPILLVTAGPSYNSAALPPVPDDIRSRTAQRLELHSCTKVTHSDRKTFDPERWLVDGNFDQHAVPMLPFSVGPRGCFRKSIAMLEMRIFTIVLLTRLQLPRLAKQLRRHGAVDGLSRKPRDCFISLRPIHQ